MRQIKVTVMIKVLGFTEKSGCISLDFPLGFISFWDFHSIFLFALHPS